MNARSLLRSVAVVTCAAVAIVAGAQLPAGAAASNELDQWSMRDSRNMVAAGSGLPVEIRDEDKLWTVKLSTHQYTMPVVSNGRIFLGLNDSLLRKGKRFKWTGGGLVMCLEAKTGKTIWQLPMPRVRLKRHFFNHVNCGVCSSPVVDGERMYLVGSRGGILCLDVDGQADGNDGPFVNELEYFKDGLKGEKALLPSDGDIIWRYDLIAELEVFPHDVSGSTLLMRGNMLFACTSHGLGKDHVNISNTTAPSLIVLDKRTGKLLARDRETIAERMLHGQWSSPSLGEVGGRPLVFFGAGDGHCYAFELPEAEPADGKVQPLRKAWSRDCNLPQYRMRDGKRVPYATRHNKSPVGPSEIIGAPVFYHGRLYVTAGQDPLHGPGESELTCLDAATGEIIWQTDLVGRSMCTVAISKGLLYVADYCDRFHCFDAEAGRRYWDHDLDSGVWAASPLLADGKVYISTERKQLFVFKEGKEKVLLHRQRPPSVAVTPVVVGGVFYLPMQKTLVAIRCRP